MRTKPQHAIDAINERRLKLDGEERKYSCGYCGKEFKAVARKAGTEKHSSASNAIKCPKCGNLLKTWDD